MHRSLTGKEKEILFRSRFVPFGAFCDQKLHLSILNLQPDTLQGHNHPALFRGVTPRPH